MGRKRKKVVQIPKKRFPKIFSCPQCGKETVHVEIEREGKIATVGCSSCGLQEEFQLKGIQSEVDAYCLFTDKIYGSSSSVSTFKDT